MRWWPIAVVMLVASCATQVAHDVDLSYANARAPRQTSPDYVLVMQGDVDQPYDVLADLEITVRQQSAFGVLPTHEEATRALRVEAAKIGAHALLFVEFGQMGMSWWSYNELRGHGRAIRFR